MHELSFVQSILSISLSYALEHRAKKIEMIAIEFGQHTGFVDESIELYWKHVSAGTIAQNAVIHITRLPFMYWCRHCQHSWQDYTENDSCPSCESFVITATNGMDARVVSVTIDTDEKAHPR